jgi:DNA-binding XRE family transcriptional regulator
MLRSDTEIVACTAFIPNIPPIMPTTALSSALKSKQKEGKLSIAAMAKAIGANSQSVTTALKGKSVPNATTAPKYAKFLGISIEEFQALTKPAAKTAKPAKKTRKSKKPAKVVPVKTAAKPAKSVTLAEAVELAADALAVATHRASAAQRKIIVAVLGG